MAPFDPFKSHARPIARAEVPWLSRIFAASVLFVLTALAVLGPVSAHDSPEHVVELLTARMKTVGPRPDLLWRRATEYRALAMLPEAERDLRAAIRRKKDFLAAIQDLSRVQLARGNSKAAAKTIQRGLALGHTAQSKADMLMLQAEILGHTGRLAEAIEACNQAIASAESANPEWYLARCQFQYQLGRFESAAMDLRLGLERTGNAVLEAEWIDAAIDAGRCEDVTSAIDKGLAESRCQASWLIRRGRVHEIQGRITQAQTDYLAALKELNGRIGARAADFTLLVERGLVYALLGDDTLARQECRRARELGADAWALNRLERFTASTLGVDPQARAAR